MLGALSPCSPCVQVTKAATRDGHHLEFDIPFDQLGFGGKPFKEVHMIQTSLTKKRQPAFKADDGSILGPFIQVTSVCRICTFAGRAVEPFCRSGRVECTAAVSWFNIRTVSSEPQMRIARCVRRAPFVRHLLRSATTDLATTTSSRFNTYTHMLHPIHSPCPLSIPWRVFFCVDSIGEWYDILWLLMVARQMGFIQPTTYALINVTDFPFFVVPLNEIEHVHFERVLSSSKTCDMKIIMKVIVMYLVCRRKGCEDRP